VQPPALPWGGEATPLAQRHARDVRDAQPRFGFDEPGDGARTWVSRVHRANRAAEAALVARALNRGGVEAQVAATSAPLRFDSAAPHDEAQLAEGSSPSTAPGYFASLRYLGQVDLTYLVCEGDGEIVLVDQHVAHERVELARLIVREAGASRGSAGDREIAVQRMLFPTTIELAPELVALAEQSASVLARVGSRPRRSARRRSRSRRCRAACATAIRRSSCARCSPTGPRRARRAKPTGSRGCSRRSPVIQLFAPAIGSRPARPKRCSPRSTPSIRHAMPARPPGAAALAARRDRAAASGGKLSG